MKIEVKSIKVAQWASEETTCYNATVYIDGKRAIAASNEGHGGCDMFHFFEGYTGPSLAEINAWLAANEPPCGPFEADATKRALYDNGSDCDLESFIGRAIAIDDGNKAIKRAMKKVCGLEGGKFYTFKCAPTAANLAGVRAKNPNMEVINDDLGDELVMARARAALLGEDTDDLAAVYKRQRENRLTAADARFLLAADERLPEDDQDEDLQKSLREIIEAGHRREERYKAQNDTRAKAVSLLADAKEAAHG